MDPDAFTASLFKWDPRGLVAAAAAQHQQQQSASASAVARAWEQQQQLGGLEELFEAYGIRYYTAAKIAELGFTARTLVNMRDEELDDMMTSLSHIFRWDLLVGERYGIKAAVRAHRRRLDHTSDALSQEGVSEEPVVQHVEKEMVVSGGDGGGEAAERRRKQRRGRGSKGGKAHRKLAANIHQLDEDENDAVAGEDDEHHISREVEEDDVVGGGRNNSNNNGGGGGGASASASAIDMVMMSMSERQREHPFIVTEPGEVARGKKNGLDYLFHLYDQCRDFLIQVQNRAKERGDKCPTKVTNEVFRYAKKAGASHINKPKMRHYVHCYALHCLDEQASNALRRAYKERGENVGSWRDACYQPVVDIAGRQAAWDIDSVFNSHPLLSIWYVPTKLRHLCHAQRNTNNNASATSLLHVAAQSHHHPRLSF